MSIITPLQSERVPETGVVKLPDYARHIQANECGFYGITGYPGDIYAGNCNSTWTKFQRDWVAYYLAEAQHEIEKVLNYNIGPRWITDEEHKVKARILTKRGYLISGGVRTVASIASGVAVSHATDPATIGPIATTVTDPDEIRLYHSGTDLQIFPSAMTLTGGALSFEVPRCRMVAPSKADNPKGGLQYSDLTNFSATVDVARVYNLDDNPARLVYQKCQTQTNCVDNEVAACMRIHRARIGSVSVSPACGCTGKLSRVKLSYLSGREFKDETGRVTFWGKQAQDAVIRLAHAKMPNPPCDCTAANEMWERDREVKVDGLGRFLRGGMSPFGPEEGAWVAWVFASEPNMALKRGATI